MQSLSTEQFSFPIGRYETSAEITPGLLATWKATLANFPEDLRAAVNGLNDQQLDTRYRPGGWTIRQVVHHVADSHLNAYIRFKLAITEDCPTIRPYTEAVWAELPEARTGPLAPSLDLLTGLHARWVMFLDHLTTDDLAREFEHPEHGKRFRLDDTIGNYAWHSAHHLAHITRLKGWKGW